MYIDGDLYNPPPPPHPSTIAHYRDQPASYVNRDLYGGETLYPRMMRVMFLRANFGGEFQTPTL